MIKDLQIDTSDLQRLKGISIAMTENQKPVLIFTYEEKTSSEKALAWLFNWYAVAVLYCVAGLLLFWMLR
jgi:hypothetical protein